MPASTATLSEKIESIVGELGGSRSGREQGSAELDAALDRLVAVGEDVARMESVVQPVEGLVEMEAAFSLPGNKESAQDMRLVDLLHRDTYWVNSSGRVHRLTEMDRDYLDNVRAFLAERDTTLYLQQAKADYLHILGGTWNQRPATAAPLAGDPSEWLLATTLYTRIVELLHR